MFHAKKISKNDAHTHFKRSSVKLILPLSKANPATQHSVDAKSGIWIPGGLESAENSEFSSKSNHRVSFITTCTSLPDSSYYFVTVPSNFQRRVQNLDFKLHYGEKKVIVQDGCPYNNALWDFIHVYRCSYNECIESDIYWKDFRLFSYFSLVDLAHKHQTQKWHVAINYTFFSIFPDGNLGMELHDM